MLKIKCSKCNKMTKEFNSIEFKNSCLPENYESSNYSKSYLKNKQMSISKVVCDKCYDIIMKETFKKHFYE